MQDIRKRDKEDVGTSGATIGDSNKIPKIHEVEANQFSLDQKFHPEKDPKKLKRLMANRVYQRRTKLKKAQYVAELEKQAKSLESKVDHLRSQVEAYQNQKHSLQIEQQTMKLQIVLQEKDRLMKEEEIEKNKAEVKKQRELLAMQLQALQFSASVQPTSGSNAIPFSGLEQMGSANSVQDPNGAGEGEKKTQNNTKEVLAEKGLRFKSNMNGNHEFL